MTPSVDTMFFFFLDMSQIEHLWDVVQGPIITREHLPINNSAVLTTILTRRIYICLEVFW